MASELEALVEDYFEAKVPNFFNEKREELFYGPDALFQKAIADVPQGVADEKLETLWGVLKKLCANQTESDVSASWLMAIAILYVGKTSQEQKNQFAEVIARLPKSLAPDPVEVESEFFKGAIIELEA